MGKLDFIRYEFKISFGEISYMANVPWLLGMLAISGNWIMWGQPAWKFNTCLLNWQSEYKCMPSSQSHVWLVVKPQDIKPKLLQYVKKKCLDNFVPYFLLLIELNTPYHAWFIFWKHKFTLAFIIISKNWDGAGSCDTYKRLRPTWTAYWFHGCSWPDSARSHRPLARYTTSRVVQVPGMPGTFSPPPTSKKTAS